MPSRTTPDFRTLYAAAGLTDLIASTMRDRLSRAQAEAVQRWTEAKQKAPEVPIRLSRLTRDRITGLPAQAGQFVSEAESAYNDLAGRGRGAVQRWLADLRVPGSAAVKPATAERTATKRPPRPAGTRRPAGRATAGRSSTGRTTPRSPQAARGAAKKAGS
jgi:hypothetical protein